MVGWPLLLLLAEVGKLSPVQSKDLPACDLKVNAFYLPGVAPTEYLDVSAIATCNTACTTKAHRPNSQRAVNDSCKCGIRLFFQLGGQQGGAQSQQTDFSTIPRKTEAVT